MIVAADLLLLLRGLPLLLLQAKDAVTGTAQAAKESAQSEADRVSMGQRWKEEMLEGEPSA